MVTLVRQGKHNRYKSKERDLRNSIKLHAAARDVPPKKMSSKKAAKARRREEAAIAAAEAPQPISARIAVPSDEMLASLLAALDIIANSDEDALPPFDVRLSCAKLLMEVGEALGDGDGDGTCRGAAGSSGRSGGGG